MNLPNKKAIVYGLLALGLLTSTGAYLYAKEKQSAKEVMEYMDPFEYFDKVSDRFFRESFYSDAMQSTFKLDVKDDEKKYLVEAELPGVKKEDIRIDYEGNTLYILVSQSTNNEDKKENYIKKERSFSQKSRAIYLPYVNKNEIKATLQNGVLTINMPKGDKKESSTQIKID